LTLRPGQDMALYQLQRMQNVILNLGCSSGKTLVYMAHSILLHKKDPTKYTIVITPSRDIRNQGIEESFAKYGVMGRSGPPKQIEGAQDPIVFFVCVERLYMLIESEFHKLQDVDDAIQAIYKCFLPLLNFIVFDEASLLHFDDHSWYRSTQFMIVSKLIQMWNKGGLQVCAASATLSSSAIESVTKLLFHRSPAVVTGENVIRTDIAIHCIQHSLVDRLKKQKATDLNLDLRTLVIVHSTLKAENAEEALHHQGIPSLSYNAESPNSDLDSFNEMDSGILFATQAVLYGKNFPNLTQGIIENPNSIEAIFQFCGRFARDQGPPDTLPKANCFVFGAPSWYLGVLKNIMKNDYAFNIGRSVAEQKNSTVALTYVLETCVFINVSSEFFMKIGKKKFLSNLQHTENCKCCNFCTRQFTSSEIQNPLALKQSINTCFQRFSSSGMIGIDTLKDDLTSYLKPLVKAPAHNAILIIFQLVLANLLELSFREDCVRVRTSDSSNWCDWVERHHVNVYQNNQKHDGRHDDDNSSDNETSGDDGLWTTVISNLYDQLFDFAPCNNGSALR